MSSMKNIKYASVSDMLNNYKHSKGIFCSYWELFTWNTFKWKSNKQNGVLMLLCFK